MLVKATATGFYGGSRVRINTEFDVPEGTTASWFVPLVLPQETVAAEYPEVVTAGVVVLPAPRPVLAADVTVLPPVIEPPPVDAEDINDLV